MSDFPLSEDDKALFRQVMQGVKPLRSGNKAQTLPTPKTPPSPPTKPRDPQRLEHFLSDDCRDPVTTHSILCYSRSELAPKQWRQLKSGQLPWVTSLDLHGLSTEGARRALCDFIEGQDSLGHRCLLIIHGKGSHHGEAPVLKNHVNQWLRQIPNVLAFHSAIDRHGGTGAIYLLLKRRR